MKHIALKIITLIILTISIIPGCSKYEDGPKLSLRTKKARLCGDWVIESVTFNGTDVTATYTAFVGSNFVLAIEKDGAYHTHGTSSDDGTWKLGEDKDDVYFKSNATNSQEMANRILKLKNKELWLKYTASNGDITITHYKAEKD